MGLVRKRIEPYLAIRRVFADVHAAADRHTRIVRQKGKPYLRDFSDGTERPAKPEEEEHMLNELRTDQDAPWKQRYHTPKILWTQIAKAAPARGLAASDRSGTYQLYAWDVPTGDLNRLTDRHEGLLNGLLSPDGRYVYYFDDQQGNEIGHYVRVPFEGGAPQDVTPDLPPYSSFGLAISQGSNLLGFTLAGADGFHLTCLDLARSGEAGAPRTLYHSSSLFFGPALSHGGEIAVLASTERSGKPEFSLIALDTSSGERIAELWDGPESSIRMFGFAPRPSDPRLLATSNRSGTERPLIWNPRTGERVDLALGELAGDVYPLDWSPDAGQVLLCQFERAVQQLYMYDLAGSTLRRLAHPGGTFGIYGATYFEPGGTIFAQWQDSTHASQLIALDPASGAKIRTVLAEGEVLPGHAWRSVSFASADGTEIQGWLGLPDGTGPFPTILETHGGPESVTTEVCSPGSQAWLDHGFAFLSINYRGSTTFGRAFQQQIWGDLGRLEVEDMAAARDWLVREGIAQPDAILLTGWSYGGYLTLQALGKRPELWAGGMAGVAIADWSIQYEDSAETLKGYQAAIFGGTPDEKPEQYAASSPITYAEQVRAPVLIIQGRNDTRTPARPIQLYEQKMRALGKQIEVEWFEAGHLGPFANTELAVAHQELMLRWAYRVLG
jgi:dipeptidyl aminopeptidase/acylaminoacyl peptidase